MTELQKQFLFQVEKKQSPEMLKIIGTVLIGLPALWFFLYLLGTVQIIGPGL